MEAARQHDESQPMSPKTFCTMDNLPRYQAEPSRPFALRMRLIVRLYVIKCDDG